MKALALRHFKMDTPLHIIKSVTLGIAVIYFVSAGIFGFWGYGYILYSTFIR